MATIAEQLTSLANTKTAIKDAIVAKGVSVADTDPFSAYPAKIGEIQGGGGAPATKFGASVDNFLNDVDENGSLKRNTKNEVVEINLSGVKELGDYVFSYYKLSNVIDPYYFYCPDLEYIRNRALYYACSNPGVQKGVLRGVNFAKVKQIDSYGMCYFSSGLYSNIGYVDLGSLETIAENGMQYAFQNCGVSGVNLSSLVSVGNNGLYGAFSISSSIGEKMVEPIYFNSLISFGSNPFGTSTASRQCFNGQTSIPEIHFRADVQAIVEALPGYSNKWGATNSDIIFDL